MILWRPTDRGIVVSAGRNFDNLVLHVEGPAAGFDSTAATCRDITVKSGTASTCSFNDHDTPFATSAFARGHTTPAVGYAGRFPAKPSLAATLGIVPLRGTWRARLPSRGGPAARPRAACARSGLLARRVPILERAWVRVVREAVAGGPPTVAGADHRAGHSPR